MTPYMKAVVGFLVALTGALATAAVDNSVVLGEWLSALATAVAAGGAVFTVPNATPKVDNRIHTIVTATGADSNAFARAMKTLEGAQRGLTEAQVAEREAQHELATAEKKLRAAQGNPPSPGNPPIP